MSKNVFCEDEVVVCARRNEIPSWHTAFILLRMTFGRSDQQNVNNSSLSPSLPKFPQSFPDMSSSKDRQLENNK